MDPNQDSYQPPVYDSTEIVEHVRYVARACMLVLKAMNSPYVVPEVTGTQNSGGFTSSGTDHDYYYPHHDATLADSVYMLNRAVEQGPESITFSPDSPVAMIVNQPQPPQTHMNGHIANVQTPIPQHRFSTQPLMEDTFRNGNTPSHHLSNQPQLWQQQVQLDPSSYHSQFPRNLRPQQQAIRHTVPSGNMQMQQMPPPQRHQAPRKVRNGDVPVPQQIPYRPQQQQQYVAPNGFMYHPPNPNNMQFGSPAEPAVFTAGPNAGFFGYGAQ